MTSDRFFAGLWCRVCRLSPMRCTCPQPKQEVPKCQK